VTIAGHKGGDLILYSPTAHKAFLNDLAGMSQVTLRENIPNLFQRYPDILTAPIHGAANLKVSDHATPEHLHQGMIGNQEPPQVQQVTTPTTHTSAQPELPTSPVHPNLNEPSEQPQPIQAHSVLTSTIPKVPDLEPEPEPSLQTGYKSGLGVPPPNLGHIPQGVHALLVEAIHANKNKNSNDLYCANTGTGYQYYISPDYVALQELAPHIDPWGAEIGWGNIAGSYYYFLTTESTSTQGSVQFFSGHAPHGLLSYDHMKNMLNDKFANGKGSYTPPDSVDDILDSFPDTPEVIGLHSISPNKPAFPLFSPWSKAIDDLAKDPTFKATAENLPSNALREFTHLSYGTKGNILNYGATVYLSHDIKKIHDFDPHSDSKVYKDSQGTKVYYIAYDTPHTKGGTINDHLSTPTPTPVQIVNGNPPTPTEDPLDPGWHLSKQILAAVADSPTLKELGLSLSGNQVGAFTTNGFTTLVARSPDLLNAVDPNIGGDTDTSTVKGIPLFHLTYRSNSTTTNSIVKYNTTYGASVTPTQSPKSALNTPAGSTRTGLIIEGKPFENTKLDSTSIAKSFNYKAIGTSTMMREPQLDDQLVQTVAINDKDGNLSHFETTFRIRGDEAVSRAQEYAEDNGKVANSKPVPNSEISGSGAYHIGPDMLTQQSRFYSLWGSPGNLTIRSINLDSGDQVLHLSSTMYSYKGVVVVKTTNAENLEKNLHETLKKFGLDHEYAQESDLENLKWHKLAKCALTPKEFAKVKDLGTDKIKEAMTQAYPHVSRIDSEYFSTVGGQHFPSFSEEFANVVILPKVGDIYACINNTSGMPGLISSGGMLSSLTRFAHGLKLQGASADSDIETGGAQYVFTRLSHSRVNVAIGQYFTEGTSIRFNPEVLRVANHLSTPEDNFGAVDPKNTEYFPRASLTRKPAWQVIDQVPDHFSFMLQHHCGNETIFKHSVPHEFVDEIVVASESNKPDYLNAMYHYSGLPVTQRTVTKVKLALLEHSNITEIHEMTDEKLNEFYRLLDYQEKFEYDRAFPKKAVSLPINDVLSIAKKADGSYDVSSLTSSDKYNEHGHQESYWAQNDQGKSFLVKVGTMREGVSSIAGEITYSQLAKSLGINVNKVNYGTDEDGRGYSVHERIEDVETYHGRGHWGGLLATIPPSSTMTGTPAEQASKTANYITSTGKMVVLDALTNCWDRQPSNLMVDRDGNSHAIDNSFMGTAISEGFKDTAPLLMILNTYKDFPAGNPYLEAANKGLGNIISLGKDQISNIINKAVPQDKIWGDNPIEAKGNVIKNVADSYSILEQMYNAGGLNALKGHSLDSIEQAVKSGDLTPLLKGSKSTHNK
jgi:hypothetical protein